ncbi:MAG: non-homologous end-joining DNA ligase [Actinomycetota bacterium]
MSLSFPVAPMKATMGSLPPADAEFDADGTPRWAYEVKWDGYRTLVHVDDGMARLQSTAGHDVTDRWPELGAIGDAVNAESAILDGELVVLDDDGRPSFSLIQRSGGSDGRPALFQAFDVLRIDDVDTVDLPYVDRRRLLDQVLDDGDSWRIPAHHLGDGAALLAATASQGLEGVIAKRTDSRYAPGRRSKDWRKVKNRLRVLLPIGGFTAGDGNRSASFGALLVGRRDGGAAGQPPVDGDGTIGSGPLRFAGGVGTGFDVKTLGDLRRRLDALVVDRSPFDPAPPSAVTRTATWVEPSLVAEIEIAEFTNDGHVRHASFLGLRDSG